MGDKAVGEPWGRHCKIYMCDQFFKKLKRKKFLG